MRAVSLPVSPVARNRKDSTPRHGRLLHPSSWAERDDRDHAAENFFQGGSPKNRPPHFPARTSSPPEIVSDQISGDGAWMNFRFSRALPPGGLAHARPDDLEAFPSGLGHAASGTTYLPILNRLITRAAPSGTYAVTCRPQERCHSNCQPRRRQTGHSARVDRSRYP